MARRRRSNAGAEVLVALAGAMVVAIGLVIVAFTKLAVEVFRWPRREDQLAVLVKKRAPVLLELRRRGRRHRRPLLVAAGSM